MKQAILNNIKNMIGWKTKRKIVVISVDDYGNVRLDSKKAREKMDEAGLKVLSRFDAYDTLETREDLEMLFEALNSVKDRNNQPAIFTPFALPCNINFEAMAENGYKKYIYETLPTTYEKLSVRNANAYEGAWDLWQEGIDNGLMKPQFHGREHLNLKVFEEKLERKDIEVITALKNRSYTSISKAEGSRIGYTAAFKFLNFDENENFIYIINDGLIQFKKVYGYPSTHFNAPGGAEHSIIHQHLKKSGIKYLDTPLIKHEHQGNGKYKKTLNFTGKKNHLGMTYQVRNVVFEPTHNSSSVDHAFKQIKAAFFWNRPAIISSHRVNFCGHIDPKNREKGISALKELLQKIVKKWPEVEFMSSESLGELMNGSN